MTVERAIFLGVVISVSVYLTGWLIGRAKNRRTNMADFASLYSSNTDAPEAGGDPQDHKFVARKPIYRCDSVNEHLGYDQWGNNPYLLHPDDKAYLDRVGVSRAGGDVVCGHCGYTYYQHPPVQGALWATRVCDRERIGRLVKL